jgi:beta-lactamase class A
MKPLPSGTPKRSARGKYQKYLMQNRAKIILLGSSLAAMALVGGAWWYSQKSTQNVPQTAKPSATPNPSVRRTVPGSSFPASSLPPSFSSPSPSLVASPSPVNTTTAVPVTSTLTPSSSLLVVVQQVVNSVTNEKLKKADLSIAVIDVGKREIAEISSRPEFPASVVKIFWAVMLYHGIDRQLWQNPEAFDALAKKMLVESDNEAASYIVDSISGAPSLTQDFSGPEWQDWRSKRLAINSFFTQRGYGEINLVQKSYPIPFMKLTEPTGLDKRLRLENTTPDRPVRNKISVEQAARLMDETCGSTSNLLSSISSNKICGWLKRDLKDPAWRKAPPIPVNDFNPIRGYLGEGVAKYPNVTIYSKAGWTKESRQEVAAIKDGKNTYIIAVFANTAAYAKDPSVFPKISEKLYGMLTKSPATARK